MASGNQNPQASRLRASRLFSRKTTGEVVFDILNVTVLIVLSLSIIYPFYTTLLLSFAGKEDATTLGVHLWNKTWQINAYRFAVSEFGNAIVAFRNSVIRTVVATVLTVFVTLLAAYPLSKRDIPGRNLMTMIILITMFFSGGIIPLYLLVRNIGLIDSFWAMILPRLAVGYYIIIMRNFLMTIDSALEESAFIDGAGYFRVLTRIIIPVSKPVIAVIALWTAVLHWNEWFHAMIFTKSDRLLVLQLLLRRLIQLLNVERGTVDQLFDQIVDDTHSLPSESVKAAVTIITIGPIILVYPFIQRYFVKGVMIGSLKG